MSRQIQIPWRANDTIRLLFCVFLVLVCIANLIDEFGLSGIAMGIGAIILLAGGMAS